MAQAIKLCQIVKYWPEFFWTGVLVNSHHAATEQLASISQIIRIQKHQKISKANICSVFWRFSGGFQNVSDVSLGLGKALGIRRSQEDGVLPEMRLIDPDRTDSRRSLFSYSGGVFKEEVSPLPEMLNRKIIPIDPRSRFTCFYIFYNSINSYTLLMFRELNQIRSWMRSAHKFRFARPGQSASKWKCQWILVRDTLHIRNSGQIHWRSSSTIWTRLGPKSLFRSGQRSVFTHAACSLIAMMMTLWYLLILYVWSAQIVRKREANELPLGLRVNALEPGAVGKGQENEWCSSGQSRDVQGLWISLACLQHRLSMTQ
jgi:hypothetical protein